MSLHPLNDSVVALMRSVSTEIILPYFGNLKDGDITEKSPGDLVTVADKKSEIALSCGLAELLPNAVMVGEEAVAADASLLAGLNADQTWIVDPIDGTGNFASGRQPFGIIVALAEKGETVAGWLYDPVIQRLSHAHVGHGAFINEKPINSSSSGAKLPIAALATGFMSDEQRERTLDIAEGRYELVDIPRCCVEQYPRLVLGQNDISVFERTLPWDHAAGILFVNEAGGKACRFDGSPYRIDDKRSGLLAAATPQLWEEATTIFTA